MLAVLRHLEGVLRWGEIFALPYYSQRGLCASMGGQRRTRGICVSLSVFFSFHQCGCLVCIYPYVFSFEVYVYSL